MNEAIKIQAPPLPEHEARRVKFPKCSLCGRRPILRAVPGQFLEITNDDGTVTKTPKYEVLPCCSARYIKVRKTSALLTRRAKEFREDLKDTDE